MLVPATPRCETSDSHAITSYVKHDVRPISVILRVDGGKGSTGHLTQHIGDARLIISVTELYTRGHVVEIRVTDFSKDVSGIGCIRPGRPQSHDDRPTIY